MAVVYVFTLIVHCTGTNLVPFKSEYVIQHELNPCCEKNRQAMARELEALLPPRAIIVKYCYRVQTDEFVVFVEYDL